MRFDLSIPQDPTVCLIRLLGRARVSTHPLSQPKLAEDAVLTSVLAKPGQIVDVPLVSSACRETNVLETDCLDSAGEPVCQLMLLRKEVIQPHLPVRLPCYDFVPIARPTFDGSLHKGWATGFGCCQLS